MEMSPEPNMRGLIFLQPGNFEILCAALALIVVGTLILIPQRFRANSKVIGIATVIILFGIVLLVPAFMAP
jgi:hypothetical protein